MHAFQPRDGRQTPHGFRQRIVLKVKGRELLRKHACVYKSINMYCFFLLTWPQARPARPGARGRAPRARGAPAANLKKKLVYILYTLVQQESENVGRKSAYEPILNHICDLSHRYDRIRLSISWKMVVLVPRSRGLIFKSVAQPFLFLIVWEDM